MNIYETSLLSLDVGFDVKDQIEPVKFPVAEVYKVKYEDRYSRQLLAAGDWERVSRTLRKAGYNVERE
jgi:hypothetical protein